MVSRKVIFPDMALLVHYTEDVFKYTKLVSL